MGQPGRPALSSGPLLGALAAVTSTIRLGTLVARIGLVPDEVLVDVLCGVDALSGGRLVAGIGTGDGLSRAENEAYGIPFESAEDPPGAPRHRWPPAVRRRGHPGVGRRRAPRDGRAGPDGGAAVNVWQVGADRVGRSWPRRGGGDLGRPGGRPPAEAAGPTRQVAAAGATWAVCAWPDSLEVVAEAAAAGPVGGRRARPPDGPSECGRRPRVRR